MEIGQLEYMKYKETRDKVMKNTENPRTKVTSGLISEDNIPKITKRFAGIVRNIMNPKIAGFGKFLLSILTYSLFRKNPNLLLLVLLNMNKVRDTANIEESITNAANGDEPSACFRNAASPMPKLIEIQKKRFQALVLVNNFLLFGFMWVMLFIVNISNNLFKPYRIIVSKSGLFLNQILRILLVMSVMSIASNANATEEDVSSKHEVKHEVVNETFVADLIKEAEIVHEIPDGLLSAIANIESGYKPFALNIGGRAIYAESLEEATRILQETLAKGASNIDIGVMQLNWRWHGKAFSGVREMLDPGANIRYAARLLRALYEEQGENWQKAVRYYHSRNAEFYKDYSRKVMLSWMDN